MFIEGDVPHLTLSIISFNRIIQMGNTFLTLFREEAKCCFGFSLKHQICKRMGKLYIVE